MIRQAAGVGLCLLVGACGPPAPPDQSPGPSAEPVRERPLFTDRPNILLLSIDTLRADHLGCYGYDRATSPNLDAFADSALRFENAYAPTPWTLPSHVAMLTGMHPYDLRIDNQWRKIPDEMRLLGEWLSDAGYQTAAFVDSRHEGLLGASRNFDRGFDRFEHGPHREPADGEPAMRFDMAATVDAAMEWLDRRSEAPFFLFLHTKSVHAVPQDDPCRDSRCLPYDKPEPFRFRFIADDQLPWTWSLAGRTAQEYLWAVNSRILEGQVRPEAYDPERLAALVALYDNGIAYTDHHFGRLLDDLRGRGLLENTVVMVTSDHGEAFLEHGLFLHHEVYEPLLRIPLLVRLPDGRGAGEVIQPLVELADLVPSLLSWLGLPRPDHMTGRPLPLVNDDVGDRELFAYYLFPTKVDYRAFAVRQGRWKLVAHRTGQGDYVRELYDLYADRDEWEPVDDPDRMDVLARALRRRLAAEPFARADEVDREAPSERTGDLLRSLGYIE